jgi:hypothetical protein
VSPSQTEGLRFRDAYAKGNSADEVKKGRDRGCRIARTASDTRVSNAERGMALGTPEASPASGYPADQSLPIVEDRPSDNARCKTVSVHADAARERHGATSTEGSGEIEVRWDGELSWREKGMGNNHGTRLATSAWGGRFSLK